MTKPRCRQHTKDETEQQEQFELLEQFKREWLERTPPATSLFHNPPTIRRRQSQPETCPRARAREG